MLREGANEIIVLHQAGRQRAVRFVRFCSRDEHDLCADVKK